jgi:hypothetical protein
MDRRAGGSTEKRAKVKIHGEDNVLKRRGGKIASRKDKRGKT